MLTVKCTYSNGDTVTTPMNGTLQDAKEYFLGNWFQFGDTDEKPYDDMQKCIKVELYTANVQVKETITEMIEYYRENDSFQESQLNKLLTLADFTDLHVSKLINKFHFINTQITSNGGIPVLKEVLKHV